MIIVKDVIQGTDSWQALRLGRPSASNFGKIITPTGNPSSQRKKYLDELFDEKITGTRVENYKNKHMERGNEREQEAREAYEFIKGVSVEQVGFIFFDEKKEFGCSPDGLVGKDRGFETKDTLPHIQRVRLEEGWSALEHKPQIQGSLYVSDRKFWDRMSFCRGMKPIIETFERDEVFIRKLAVELRMFVDELNELIEKYSI